MARTRAVPRRRPNINFQQRGNIDFERQRVAATRNIILQKVHQQQVLQVLQEVKQEVH